MKKATKKIMSCLLVLVFCLSPLLLTGCIDVSFNESIANWLAKWIGTFEPTYYIGALYQGEEDKLYVGDAKTYGSYTQIWENYSSKVLNAFCEEFNSEKPKDTTRTDYYADYYKLLGNRSSLNSEDFSNFKEKYYQKYAGFFNGLYYGYSYEEGDKIVIVLSETNGKGDDGNYSDDGPYQIVDGKVKLNPYFVSYDSATGNFVSTGNADIATYSESGTNWYQKKEWSKDATKIIHSASTSSFRTYSFSYGKKIWDFFDLFDKECFFLIGDKNDFYNTFSPNDSSSSRGRNALYNYLFQLYDTNYKKIQWHINYSNFQVYSSFSPNVVASSPVQIRYIMTNSENKSISNNDIDNQENRALFAAQVIKNVFFTDLDQVPTAVSLNSLRNLQSSGSWPDIVDTYSLDMGNGGNGDFIRKITMADIYNALETNSRVVESADKSEKIELVDSGMYVAEFFIMCSYQFLYGIAGIPNNSETYMNMVATALKESVLDKIDGFKQVYSSTGQEVKYKEKNEWDIFYLDYMVTSVASGLTPIASLVVNSDRTLEMREFDYQNVVAMSVITGTALDKGKEADAYIANGEDDNVTSVMKQYQEERANFYTTKEKRKYFSFTFEAWGQNYTMDNIMMQFEYLTEDEKEKGVVDTSWTNVYNHYTFIIQKCAYDENTNEMKEVFSCSIKANDAEFFSTSDIQEGFIFIDFDEMISKKDVYVNGVKQTNEQKKTLSRELVFNDLIGEDHKIDDKSLGSSESNIESGSRKKYVRDRLHTPFLRNSTTLNDFFYVRSYDKNGNKAMVYEKGLYASYGEEYIQIIFAVDDEANRVPMLLKELII